MEIKAAAAIGAYVNDVDLTDANQARDLVEPLNQAIADYGVLFFRDQALSGEQLVAFSQLFGPSFIQPALAHKYQELLIIETNKDRPPYLNTFHQDMTGLAAPPSLHMLHALIVPTGGGDTMWSSSYAVYEALSPAMKQFLEGLTATHSLLQYYAPIFARWPNGEDKIAEFRQRFPAVSHPVICTHPVTKRKGIYVNPYFTQHIDGLTEPESTTLLSYLYDQIKTPEYCVRLCWEEGTLAIWDNRCTSHYALADYYPQRRKMQRATVCGEKPQ